jgi:Ca2+/Na+ antiporter
LLTGLTCTGACTVIGAMRFIDFRTFSLWTNVAIFAGAGILVWAAGTRLAVYADAISTRTRLSKAFLGLVLLGLATSSPEVAATFGVLIAYPLGLVTLYFLR